MDSELFPKLNRPLFTPDSDRQCQIVERIKQAQRGEQIHRRGGKGGGVRHAYYGLPMGEHPQISNGQLGDAWGVSRQTADVWIQHPGKLDPDQVHELCRLCGVTLKWLRYGGENDYGKCEDSETVAILYDMLPTDDKILICQLLERVAGPDLVSEARAESWIRQSKVWYDRHTDKAELIRQRGVRRSAQEAAQAFGLQDRADVAAFLRSLPSDQSDG